MLRLERRKQSIHITLQGGEPLWSRPFFIAFCVALSLHSLAFLLIHVRPIITHAKEIFLHPVIVNAHIEVEASLEGAPKRNPYDPLLPQPMLPDLPALPFLSCRKPAYPFQSTLTPDLGYPEKPHPLTITVSGPLAKARLFKNELPNPDTCLREKCAVKVDNQTGKVFWTDNQDPQVETLLKNLFFATECNDLFTSGTIEVTYD